MKYEEFSEFEEAILPTSNLIKSYKCKTGEIFYVEPAFYTQMNGFKERYPEDYEKVVDRIKILANEKKKVMFVYDFENPFLDLKDYILVEFVDVTDSIKLFYEDKSRGSDYGD